MNQDKHDKQDFAAPLKNLTHNLMSRRLVVEKPDGQELFEAPLIAGLGAMAVLGPWTAVGVAAVLLTDHSIRVRRRKSASAPEAEPIEDVMVADTGPEPEVVGCQATTKAGTPCKLPARPGSAYCHIHQPDA